MIFQKDGKKKLVGDVDPVAHPYSSLFTSVPGGIGLLTTSALCFNILNCYRLQKNLPLLSLRNLIFTEAAHVYQGYIQMPSQVNRSTKGLKLNILLFSSSYNGMTQSVERTLQLDGHNVSFQRADSSESMLSAVEVASPDIIICPTLMVKIPAEIYTKIKCLIVHPGIKGDRGPSSIDWAILQGLYDWGVTVLEAADEMDAGDVWATMNFPVSPRDTKSSIYNGKIIPAATALVQKCVEHFSDPSFCPETLDYENRRVNGRPMKAIRQGDSLRDH